MWRVFQVDDFDLFKDRMLGSGHQKTHRHKRALLFVDNSGADVVLGMLPLARELLRRGTEVNLLFLLLLRPNFNEMGVCSINYQNQNLTILASETMG